MWLAEEEKLESKVKSHSQGKCSICFTPLQQETLCTGTNKRPILICSSRFQWWSNRTISLLDMTNWWIEKHLLLHLFVLDLVAEAIRPEISNYCRLPTIYHWDPTGLLAETGRGYTPSCTRSHTWTPRLHKCTGCRAGAHRATHMQVSLWQYITPLSFVITLRALRFLYGSVKRHTHTHRSSDCYSFTKLFVGWPAN